MARCAWVGIASSFVAPVLFGVAAIGLGQDTNWDLRNYHWYNPYAWLNDRFTIDLAPATYYNPLLDVPLYLIAQHVPARACTFLLGALHGLNFVPLYLLARLLCPTWARWRAGTGGALIATVGVTGGGALGLLGTTFYDNVVSILVVSAACIGVWALGATVKRPLVAFAGAGLLIGLATGLKLPVAIFAVGFAIACLFAPASINVRLARVVAFGGPATVGLSLSTGFWMWQLFAAFGNPVYPYFNDLFGSPMALSASYRDERFVPDTLLEAIALPFSVGFAPLSVGEVVFRDYRLLALFGVLLAGAAMGLRRERVAPPHHGIRFVVVMTLVSFAVWEGLFAIYRYIVALEMVAPVIAAALIARLPVRGALRSAIALCGAIVLLATTRFADWGHAHFGARFVEATAPPLAAPADTLALMIGFVPASWVIPSFPPEVAFVRLQGYSHHPDDGDVGLAATARRRVEAHRGAFGLLYSRDERTLAREVLDRYGLVVNGGACLDIRGNLDSSLQWCAVERKAGTR